MVKIACITGTRPELIKMAPVIKAFQKYTDIDLTFIHSGQHYDQNMSNAFTQELGLPKPSDNPIPSHKSSKIQNSDKQSMITINLPSASNSFSTSNPEKTEIEVSVVIPCLNEEPTIGECIKKIKSVFQSLNLLGEIIVSDSSTYNSPTIAKKLGAKVVHPPERGYGNAYLTGISEARGKYIIMTDADGTYDLQEISKFIKILKNDNTDIVMGTRLKGKILPGAMPRLHRYIGNPLLTLIANILFGTRISDMHCGMRAITKKAWEKIRAVSPGMKFASEMLIKAVKNKLKITETPITYHPRKGTSSKLNPLKDGYRHLKLLIKLRFTKIFTQEVLCLRRVQSEVGKRYKRAIGMGS